MRFDDGVPYLLNQCEVATNYKQLRASNQHQHIHTVFNIIVTKSNPNIYNKQAQEIEEDNQPHRKKTSLIFAIDDNNHDTQSNRIKLH